MKRQALVVVLGFVSFMFLAGMLPSKVSCAGPIELNWVSVLPKNNPETKAFQKFFVDRVNELAKGELFIKYRGGPEVMAPPNIAPGVKKGVVDIATIFVGFYEAIVPGIAAAMLTELTPYEERKPGGAYDFMLEHHKKHGLMYLGRQAPSVENFFYCILNKRVEKPQDFAKLKIGSATAARPAAKAWGASVVPIKPSDYYTAMERNLVDGVASCPLLTWAAQGCEEVSKYVIDHPYYKSTAMSIMNLKSWNRLPKHLQNLMNQVMIAYPRFKMENHTNEDARARVKILDAGVEFYRLSPETAEWFLGTANKAAWNSRDF